MNLLFIDNRIPLIDKFINGCNNISRHVIYNVTDTFDSIKEQIKNLNISTFSYIGFVFSNDYSPLKMFVSHNTFFSFNDGLIIENNTTSFIKELITSYSVSTIDFLACSLLIQPLWKKYFEFLMKHN
jgi:hypothetical protein